jgi:predicted permease
MCDLRLACRQLLKDRGFTAVAVLSLGMAIGANIAVFSLVNAVLLRALPVPEPRQLRVLNWSGPLPNDYRIAGEEVFYGRQGRNRLGMFSYPSYLELRDQTGLRVELFAFAPTEPVTAITRGTASRAAGVLVSGNFFSTYGARPWVGRAIQPEDNLPGAAPVVVLTHRWWELHYGSDPGIVGQSVELNQTVFAIVGVLPRGFAGPLPGDTADLYIPLAFQPLFRPDDRQLSPNDYWLQIMLRLPRGTSEEPVRVALETAFQRHQRPLSDPEDDPPKLHLHAGASGPWIQRMMIADPLESLTRIVAWVLLIACANVTGMWLARNAARQHDWAVRAALGAGRWRLGRQVLAESMLLALAVAGLGLLLSYWGRKLLIGLLPVFTEYNHFDFRTDATVLGYTLGVTTAAMLLVGVIPAWFASRAQPAAGLQNPRVLGAPRLRLGRFLVVIQVAMTVVLLAGAGLMVRTQANLRSAELGFAADHLLVFRLNVAQVGHPESGWTAFYSNVSERIAALPGVEAAAFADQSHLGAGFGTGYGIRIPGRESESLACSGMIVGEKFLPTLQIPLLVGRGFSHADNLDAERVAVVNEAFAKEMFPGEYPLGKTFVLAGEMHQIVGVCGNARLYNLRADTCAITYLAYSQRPVPEAWFAVRSRLTPTALAPVIRQIVADLDPQVVIADLTTQRKLAARQTATERLFAVLGGGLALLAVGLSCLGLYGLTSYNVTRRIPEIGIRIALGARPADVMRSVLGDAIRMACMGAAIGVVAALGAVRVIEHALYGVPAQDPFTLVAAGTVLILVTILAALIPARRAARVDPMVALRSQ